jgi:putative flavoprotein involved in K+ transport
MLARVERESVVVAGAGAAGLAAAGRLKAAGIPAVIIEKSGAVGASWRRRYDSLRLNTLRWMSDLPGYRMHRQYGRWPSRDEWVAYLERYAGHHDLDVRFETELRRVDRDDGGWSVDTSRGRMETENVVIAIGFDHDPQMPTWPGMDGFPGEILHSSAYRNPEPFKGKDVLVVGPGNTGSEIAHELVRGGARRVRASMRTPPNIVNREQFGLPILNILAAATQWQPVRVFDANARFAQRLLFGDLSKYGIPRSPYGFAENIYDRAVAPIVDDGFIDAVKRGEIGLLPVIERFEGSEVVLVDGRRLEPDVVIACTGFERGLEPIVGHLGVLTDDGRPQATGGKPDPRVPGLYFIGYTAKPAGQLREFKFDSKRIARSISRRQRRPRVAA